MYKKLLYFIFILGLVFLIVGIIGSAGDLTKIVNAFSNDADYTLVEKHGSDQFSDLKINLKSADLAIHFYDEANYKIEFYESKYDTKSIKVENETLKIEQELGSRVNWFNFKFTSKKITTINLYLPKIFNGKVEIKTSSGNISIDAFQFESLNIKVASGNIRLTQGIVATDMNLETSSGKISLNELITGNLKAKTSSGKIKLSNATIKTLSELKTSSGNIELTDIEAKEVRARVESGNIYLTNVKIISIDAETSSGNIRITINDEVVNYQIEAEVNSGVIYYNDKKIGKSLYNLSGSHSIKAKTASGNIYIKISK